MPTRRVKGKRAFPDGDKPLPAKFRKSADEDFAFSRTRYVAGEVQLMNSSSSQTGQTPAGRTNDESALIDDADNVALGSVEVCCFILVVLLRSILEDLLE